MTAYDEAMSLWPQAFESRYVDTRFGTTHVVVSGSATSPPVLLLHAATGFGAAQWYPNAGRISEHYRMYAVDYIGSAGKGVQSRPLLTRRDCGAWLADVIGGLPLDRPAVVGSSQGGWLALNLALLRPALVGALVLLAPAACFAPIRPLIRLFLALGPRMPSWTGPPALKAQFGGRLEPDERITRLLALQLKHFRYQDRAVVPEVFPEGELRTLEVETLLLVGEHEVIYDPDGVLGHARTFRHVEAELIPSAGHLINMERPELSDAHLIGFLMSLTA